MDQLKIGKFIAECRKQKNLTQMQLAEKLGITDKAISKWERGISMPDSSIMLMLCDILGISVNELLCGEKNNMEKVMGEGQGFERIRRVTGYLAGDVSRFNNGKRAEERDRVKHTGVKELLKKDCK